MGEGSADKKKRTRDEDVEEDRQIKGKQDPVRWEGKGKEVLNADLSIWSKSIDAPRFLTRSMLHRAMVHSNLIF